MEIKVGDTFLVYGYSIMKVTNILHGIVYCTNLTKNVTFRLPEDYIKMRIQTSYYIKLGEIEKYLFVDL